jgi:hypothetical protein
MGIGASVRGASESMSGFAGRNRTRCLYAVVAMVSAGLLASAPARAGDGSELQPGGFTGHPYGSADLFAGAADAAQDFGRIELGPESSAVYPEGFAPSAVSPALGLSRFGDFLLPEGPASASPALRNPRLPTEAYSPAEDTAVSYFTPRFSGLQFGATYSPDALDAADNSSLRAQARQDSLPRRDFALGVNFLESFNGVDLALSGGYESATAPTVPDPGEAMPAKAEDLARYSVGTSIGFSGLKLGGFYAREVGEGSVTAHSWDAGVSYAVGPWTIGVDYLRTAFIDTSGSGAETEDELQSVQAGLTYSTESGIVATVNILHSSLEDGEGNASSGTLGILGFSYNF